MKPLKITGQLFAILMLLMLSNLNASAHTTRSRELCGTIESIDHAQHMLIVLSPKTGQARQFLVRKDTKFLKDWQSADANAAVASSHACVYYRSPFFGKPFITKVVLLNEPTKKMQQ